MRAEAASLHQELLSWCIRQNFCNRVDYFKSQLDPAELFTRSYLKWFQEALLASRVAQLVRAERVRLLEQRDYHPDFELELRNGTIWSIQATEVVSPSRRRGAEYKVWRDNQYAVRRGDRSVAAAVAIGKLRYAAQTKSNLRYLPKTMSLLIYLNLDAWNEREIERKMVSAVKIARHRFSSVWVLWGNRLYRCWPEPWSSRRGGNRPMSVELRSVRQSHLIARAVFGAGRDRNTDRSRTSD